MEKTTPRQDVIKVVVNGYEHFLVERNRLGLMQQPRYLGYPNMALFKCKRLSTYKRHKL